ncbi:MAG: ABC transporter permease [Aggregatilineales bacterium]
MFGYILKRILLFIPTLLVVSFIVFLLIQLPPGDFLDTMVLRMQQSGTSMDAEAEALLRERYALDQPFLQQYSHWISNIVTEGDFGRSFTWNRPVSELIWSRLGWTFFITISSLLFTWALAFPIAVYSATHQYSFLDYLFSFIGFIGLAVPNFLLALVLMWIGFSVFNVSMGGLFSSEYRDAPWSLAKFLDFLSHLWVPIIVLGTAGTASLIRTMRANLLDELNKPYVEAARAKGLTERHLIWKYPVRVALNPFVSSLATLLPTLISGATIVSVVLSLPTTGPMMLDALLEQDMFLAGSFLLMLSFFTLVSTLVSDILLIIIDPRVNYE